MPRPDSLTALWLATAIAAATGCAGQSTTTLLLTLGMAPGETAPSQVVVSVYDSTHGLVLDRVLTPARIPGRLVVQLPDVDQTLRVVVDGPVTGPTRLESFATVQVHPFDQASADLRLSAATLDADGDGVPDQVDNCPSLMNPEQAAGGGGGDPCTAPLAVSVESRCPSAGFALCDGFEAPLDPNTWTVVSQNAGAITSDSTRSARGRRSVHYHLAAQTASSEMIQMIQETKTTPSVATFIRALVLAPGAPMANVQVFKMAATGPPYHMAALQLGGDGTVAILYFHANGSSLNQSKSSGQKIPFTQWSCLELEFADSSGDGASNGFMRAWLNGHDIGITITGIPAQAGPGYDQVRLGLEHDSTSTIPGIDLWIDELAIDSNPIGCAR